MNQTRGTPRASEAGDPAMASLSICNSKSSCKSESEGFIQFLQE